MNGFVAKPLTRAKLSGIFADLIGNAPIRRSMQSDQRSALVEEFGAGAYEELVDALVEDGHALVNEARAATDPETRRRAMHSLKGMARTLGFEAMGASPLAPRRPQGLER